MAEPRRTVTPGYQRDPSRPLELDAAGGERPAMRSSPADRQVARSHGAQAGPTEERLVGGVVLDVHVLDDVRHNPRDVDVLDDERRLRATSLSRASAATSTSATTPDTASSTSTSSTTLPSCLVEHDLRGVHVLDG